jgi:pyruvate/2-oxoglutarate dehydrogenase complex dihydrolipoamide dehydrogenase (E3) component
MKGIEKAVTAVEVDNNPQKTGERVVIINGGLAGIELGIRLASFGRTVTILEEGGGLSGIDAEQLRDVRCRMVSSGLDARCNAKVFEITDSGVDCEGGFIEADTVVCDGACHPERIK